MTDESVRPRLSPLPKDRLTAEQAEVDGDLRGIIGQYLQGFATEDAAGGLIGPFTPMVHFPVFGGPTADFFHALAGNTTLPKPVREVVILSVGAASNAMYELYSHEVVARGAGLSESKIRAIGAGQRPADLSEEEAIAYDTANVLLAGRRTANSLYAAAVRAFGPAGAAELAYLVGCYQLLAALLNQFDVAVPGEGSGAA